MDPSLPLGLRDALNPDVPALAVQLLDALAGQDDGESLMSAARVRSRRRAVLSTKPLGHGDIGISQFCDEEAGVLAALGGPDLDGALLRRHVSVPFMCLPTPGRLIKFH